MSMDTSKIQNHGHATFLSKMGETWNSIFSTPARGSDQSRLDQGDISSASPTQTPTKKKYNSGGASSLILQSEDSPDDTPSGTKGDGQGVRNPATLSSVLRTTHAPTPNTMSMGRIGSEHNQTRINNSSSVLHTTQAPTLNTMSMGRSGSEHNQTRLNKSTSVLQTTRSPTLNTMSMGRSGTALHSQTQLTSFTRGPNDEIEVEEEQLNEDNAWDATQNEEEADLLQQPRDISNQERLSQVKQQLLHLLQRQNSIMFRGDTTPEQVNQLTEMIRRAKIARDNLVEILTLEDDVRTTASSNPTPETYVNKIRESPKQHAQISPEWSLQRAW